MKEVLLVWVGVEGNVWEPVQQPAPSPAVLQGRRVTLTELMISLVLTHVLIIRVKHAKWKRYNEIVKQIYVKGYSMA